MSKITRRELLEIAAVAAAGGAGAARSEALGSKPRVKRELYTRSPIEIYANTLSAASGDEVTVHVSTVAERFGLKVARVGLTDEVVWTKDNLPGEFYPTPDDAWEKGCRWPVAAKLKIPRDWRSGFYQIAAIVSDDSGKPATALTFVIVRAENPTAKILLVHATATYGAYNVYGGAGLYQTRDGIWKGWFKGGERRVSFQRPWVPFDFGGDFEVAGAHWDHALTRWMEKNGYGVDHAISSDLELHPKLLKGYSLMLSVGHDEYWSWAMRDTVESFVAKGGNACFFSGNVAVWQIRHEDNGNTMVCYKEAVEQDPQYTSGNRHLTTTRWSSPIVGRPETSLTGLSGLYGGLARAIGGSPQGAGGYLVYRPDHWIFKDSGLVYGDCLGQASRIVHFEVDGCPIRMEDGLPYPDANYDGPSSLEILCLCPAAWTELSAEMMDAGQKLLGSTKAWQAYLHRRGQAVMGVFTNNGTVFCAGTTDWANGLTGKDPAVEQVTRNLLNRLSV